MKLNYSRTEHVTTDVPESVILEAAIEIVERRNEIRECWLDKDNNLCYEQYGGSHSWITDDGPATPEQIEAFNVVKHLKLLKNPRK